MKPQLRKLTLKLLLLVTMIGGLFFFVSSRTAHASYYCDEQFRQCKQTCGNPIDQLCLYNCTQDRDLCEFWID